MPIMKMLLTAFASLSLSLVALSDTVVDVYKFKMRLKVPQVLENTTSRGYRKFKSQTVAGYLLVYYHDDGTIEFGFTDLYNKNFKVGGAAVTYEALVDPDKVYPRLNYIGDNAKESFKTATMSLYAEFIPSYSKGGGGEDNSFLLTFAGKGSTSTSLVRGCRLPRTFTGNCAGTQGCGCAAYTHKSPTRRASACGPTLEETDVAACWGTWTATFVKKFSRQICK